MPRPFNVFGGKETQDVIARQIDRDLALNTRGPIRPVSEADLGRKTDLDIARGALGGRDTVIVPRPTNYPPDNREQVPPTKMQRYTKRVRPSTARPLSRSKGR